LSKMLERKMINTNHKNVSEWENTRDYRSRTSCGIVKEYSVWKHMLRRCTDEFGDDWPSYSECTVSENFKSYTFFYEWCQEQVGFGNVEDNGNMWCLDKDLLVKGNKLYSEDTCVFIPLRINNIIIKRDKARGEYPIGVSFDSERSKFKASCGTGKGGRKLVGRYSTVEQAFQAYKTFKEALIKEVANDYKNLIDPRAYQALMNYEVNEND